MWGEAAEADVSVPSPRDHEDSPCRSCGACCSYSRTWPRFTIETDLAIERLPREFVDRDLAYMRCEGNRCSALIGQVGVATSCAVYPDRPEVCRACTAGDDACLMAREKHGLPAISPPVDTHV
jgi:Fe-S-cluster containining protein